MSQSTLLPGDAGVPAKKPFYARWWFRVKGQNVCPESRIFTD
jgi:hypothetical protein